jgi:Nnf1
MADTTMTSVSDSTSVSEPITMSSSTSASNTQTQIHTHTTSTPQVPTGPRMRQLRKVFEKFISETFGALSGAEFAPDLVQRLSALPTTETTETTETTAGSTDNNTTSISRARAEDFCDQILNQVQRNIEAEFEVICDESNLVTLLNKLDMLVSLKKIGVSNAPGVHVSPLNGNESAARCRREMITQKLAHRDELNETVAKLRQENAKMFHTLSEKRNRAVQMQKDLQTQANIVRTAAQTLQQA